MKRTKKQVPGKLCMYWGKLPGYSPDIIYQNGPGVDRCDRRLLHWWFASKHPGQEHSLLDELKSRGYDLTTIEFSIRKAQSAPAGGGE